MAVHESSSLPIDREALMERVGDDWELLATLLGVFAEQEPHLLASLETALVGEDLDAVARAAHGLASSLGALAALDALSAARTLERTARLGNTAELPFARHRLQTAFDAFRLDIRVLNRECDRRTRSLGA